MKDQNVIAEYPCQDGRVCLQGTPAQEFAGNRDQPADQRRDEPCHTEEVPAPAACQPRRSCCQAQEVAATRVVLWQEHAHADCTAAVKAGENGTFCVRCPRRMGRRRTSWSRTAPTWPSSPIDLRKGKFIFAKRPHKSIAEIVKNLATTTRPGPEWAQDQAHQSRQGTQKETFGEKERGRSRKPRRGRPRRRAKDGKGTKRQKSRAGVAQEEGEKMARAPPARKRAATRRTKKTKKTRRS